MNTTTKTQLNWLRLARGKNIGPVTFFQLLKIFGSAESAVLQLPSYLRENSIKKKIEICSESVAEKELENLQKFGAKILLFSDQKYPPLLREISDPPPVLTIKGNPEFLSQKIVAIVGARNASLNGIFFTKQIAADLGKNSIVITSGMARGIDSAAHQAAIKTGTIAVIAGGINHIYPKENSKLYQEITEQGLLLSENAYDSTPEKYSFVQRNRIISGLSIATIVVEAGLKSGSLTTAKFAAEQGREVFAVPGSPLDPRCQGTNRLIKDGAGILESAEDVLNEISAPNFQSSEEELMQKNFDKEVKLEVDETKKIREEICQKLSFNSVDIDQLIEEIKVSPSLANRALVELELAEKITINFGKIAINPSHSN